MGHLCGVLHDVTAHPQRQAGRQYASKQAINEPSTIIFQGSHSPGSLERLLHEITAHHLVHLGLATTAQSTAQAHHIRRPYDQHFAPVHCGLLQLETACLCEYARLLTLNSGSSIIALISDMNCPRREGGNTAAAKGEGEGGSDSDHGSWPLNRVEEKQLPSRRQGSEASTTSGTKGS